jgi:hypothetical protein
MPVASTPRQLARAIRTRSTRTTKALKQLFTNPGQHLGTADFNRLDTPHALDAVNGQLPAWAQNRLSTLSPLELSHIGSWPDEDKERVREALVKAVKKPLPVKFFWEVHPGPNEVTLIEDPDMTGGITIIFRSPESNVKGGDVTVDVG